MKRAFEEDGEVGTHDGLTLDKISLPGQKEKAKNQFSEQRQDPCEMKSQES